MRVLRRVHNLEDTQIARQVVDTITFHAIEDAQFVHGRMLKRNDRPVGLL